MFISLVFSVTIYQLNFHEVNVRLENLQRNLMDSTLIQPLVSVEDTFQKNQDDLRIYQSQQAAVQMILALVYINGLILVFGGLGSYFLSRRTLGPIEKAHDAQSRFTSDASHELRTPLAAMKAELEVYLRDEGLTLDEAKELLGSNLEEVNKLITLSEMLLKMARLDYDKLKKEQIDLVELLPRVMKPFSQSKKRFTITTRKNAVVTANESAVMELMSILIENAIKYSPQRSRISIRIFERRTMTGFEIKNSGEPINPEKLPHIFDRFYRADNSRTHSDTSGFGLGLAIAKKITEIHHGYIQASSSDKETSFTFYLPNLRNITAKIQTPHL
ncbi:GHKL domain-containing protein [Candidatus Saccharibacteria bacterium]|nr:GHKL domain-containing protein [Candidatus Saccharibacteria bacterium]